jgi:hypothetical protein
MAPALSAGVFFFWLCVVWLLFVAERVATQSVVKAEFYRADRTLADAFYSRLQVRAGRVPGFCNWK